MSTYTGSYVAFLATTIANAGFVSTFKLGDADVITAQIFSACEKTAAALSSASNYYSYKTCFQPF